MDDAGSAVRPRRALILAGGGMKVAFQAGVLQVLLDEALDLEFDEFDGASGGTFNLAMLCQGMTGRRIADNWRDLRPLRLIRPNPRVVVGESLGRLDHLRDGVFMDWGLDFNRIQASELDATFNVYDFSRHELLMLGPADLTADMLIACVSLPGWFPPVRSRGDALIDAVFITDANVEHAIASGADELWVIWTVSRRGRWRSGPVDQYFQVVETAAYGHFKRALARVEASNRALTAGDPAEFGRPITVRVLYARVPLHYLINVSARRFGRAVDAGVAAGREWCREFGVEVHAAPLLARTAQTVRFTEEMRGTVTLGPTAPGDGMTANWSKDAALMFHLTMAIDDVGMMLRDPDHAARAFGWVESAQLGGRLPVVDATFNLFIDVAGPRRKEMRYRLFFHDSVGTPLTLTGVKDVHDDRGFDAWRDLTTLPVRLLAGHIEQEAGAEVVGGGTLRISPLAFARELSTFRGSGPGPFGGARAVLRFGWAFAGNVFQVYGAPARSAADEAFGGPNSDASPSGDAQRRQARSDGAGDAVAERNGVVLRTRGQGAPVYVLAGLEGSGESCLHLVLPVLEGGPPGVAPVRAVLVDFAAEQHRRFDDLVATIAALIDEHQGEQKVFGLWCQSFGTLLGASLLHRTGLVPDRLVLVSAFRELPAWKVSFTPTVLGLTPDVVYRATIKPIARWQFGPDGGNTGHPFYRALARVSKADFGRRIAWLHGRSFQTEFEALPRGRGMIWLGAEDRLERVHEELKFFKRLAANGGPDVSLLEGSGHVVLPPTVITEARRRMSAWFWAHDPAPGRM